MVISPSTDVLHSPDEDGDGKDLYATPIDDDVSGDEFTGRADVSANTGHNRDTSVQVLIVFSQTNF